MSATNAGASGEWRGGREDHSRSALAPFPPPLAHPPSPPPLPPRHYFTSLNGITSALGRGPKSSPNLIGGRSWNMKSHFHRSDGFEAWSQDGADTGRANAIAG